MPGIVGFGKACEISRRVMDEEMKKHTVYRDKIIDALSEIENVHINGHKKNRLTNNINISIDNVSIDALIGDLKEIALSTGSACTSAAMAPSHVLSAIGRNDKLGRSSLRISFGRFTTEEEIEYVCERITSAIKKLTKDSSFRNMAEEEIS